MVAIIQHGTHSTTQTFTRLFAAICLVVVGAAPEIGARVTDRPFHSEAANSIIGIYEERKYIQLTNFSDIQNDYKNLYKFEERAEIVEFCLPRLLPSLRRTAVA